MWECTWKRKGAPAKESCEKSQEKREEREEKGEKIKGMRKESKNSEIAHAKGYTSVQRVVKKRGKR